MEFTHDPAREELFNSSYKIKPSINIKYDVNPDGTFKTFTLKFVHKDKEWILEEVYKGVSNMTDYCTLTGLDDKFDKFYQAELKLVELMKNGDFS